jgi:hypothetical protein
VFRDGGFVVLTPVTAKLVIEVKSSLVGAEKDGEIETAFNNIHSVKEIDPKVKGFIFGYNGNKIDTFVEHVKKWGLGAHRIPRNEWPDRVYNLEQEFMMVPTLGTAESDGSLKNNSTHSIYSYKTVIRSFLTEALMAINLAVREFLTEDPIGDPKKTF